MDNIMKDVLENNAKYDAIKKSIRGLEHEAWEEMSNTPAGSDITYPNAVYVRLGKACALLTEASILRDIEFYPKDHRPKPECIDYEEIMRPRGD